MLPRRERGRLPRVPREEPVEEPVMEAPRSGDEEGGASQAYHGQGHNLRMQQTLERLAQSLEAFCHHQHIRTREEDYVCRARQMGVTHFFGTQEPAEAEAWVRYLELVFQAMRCLEEDKIITVSLLLGQGALLWWLSVLEHHPRPDTLTWADFRKAFDRKYVPRVYRDAKRAEFIHLIQGNLSVAEYEAKFTELSRYASSMVADQWEKCRKFEEGLQDEIHTTVAAIGFGDYDDIVESALRVEQGVKKQKQRMEKWKKRNNPISQVGGSLRPSKKSNSSSSGGSFSRGFKQGKPKCPTCNKYHFGTCIAAGGIVECYYCHQLGHFKKECQLLAQRSGTAPQLSAGGQGAQQMHGFSVMGNIGGSLAGSSRGRSRGEGRRAQSQMRAQAFAMTQQEAVNTPDVIAGKGKNFARAAECPSQA